MARVHFVDDPPPWTPPFEELRTAPPQRQRPLDPPPPCFSTPSPLRIRSRDFPPIFIPAATATLADGFRLLFPCGVLERHGLTRADWTRFLQDLALVARPVRPRTSHPWRTLGSVYDARFAHSVAEDIRALIRIWNECAFERRKIRVSLLLPGVQQQTETKDEAKSWTLMVESL